MPSGPHQSFPSVLNTVLPRCRAAKAEVKAGFRIRIRLTMDPEESESGVVVLCEK